MKYLIIFFLIVFSTAAISQDSLVLQPGPEGKDALISDYYTQNFGDYPNMFAMAGTHSGDPFVCRSLLEFDLSVLPDSVVIFEARLSLYFANNPSNPYTHYGDNIALLQRVIGPWEEYEVTWQNQPLSTEENQAVLPVSTGPQQDYLNIDITPLILDIVNDPENSHGILFRLQTEEMYRRMMFASGDYENPQLWPRLVIIYGDCNPPVTGFTYTADERNVYFQDASLGAVDYYWDFGDGYYSDLVNPWHYYQEEGTYEVCLTTWNDCWSNTYCEWIEVCERPQAAFTFIIDGMTAYFENQSIKGDDFYWDFGDGYYSDVENPMHIYDNLDNYEVCLRAMNECGNDTLCEMLYITSVKIDENNINSFNIYPNPACDELFIRSSRTGQAEFRLLDMTGKGVLVKNLSLSGDSQRVSLSNLEPGFYIAILTTESERAVSKIAISD